MASLGCECVINNTNKIRRRGSHNLGGLAEDELEGKGKSRNDVYISPK